jgi:hypothetical protein
MMKPGSYDLEDMTLQQLADLREWQLERLEKVTHSLRQKVREEYQAGTNIKTLASVVPVVVVGVKKPACGRALVLLLLA